MAAYVDEGSAAELLFILNPLYCFLSMGRWCVMGTELDSILILSAVIWSFVLFVGGFHFFRAAEERYARD